MAWKSLLIKHCKIIIGTHISALSNSVNKQNIYFWQYFSQSIDILYTFNINFIDIITSNSCYCMDKIIMNFESRHNYFNRFSDVRPLERAPPWSSPCRKHFVMKLHSNKTQQYREVNVPLRVRKAETKRLTKPFFCDILRLKKVSFNPQSTASQTHRFESHSIVIVYAKKSQIEKMPADIINLMKSSLYRFFFPDCCVKFLSVFFPVNVFPGRLFLLARDLCAFAWKIRK